MTNKETSLEVTIYYFSFFRSFIMIPIHLNSHDLSFPSYSNINIHETPHQFLVTTTGKKLKCSSSEVTERKMKSENINCIKAFLNTTLGFQNHSSHISPVEIVHMNTSFRDNMSSFISCNAQIWLSANVRCVFGKLLMKSSMSFSFTPVVLQFQKC